MIKLKQLLAEENLKMSIPSDIKRLYKLFKKNKKELFIVGGAVRDAILNKSPKDFDLATDATSDETIKIAKQGGFKHTDEVGKAMGVVIVNGHEIATFRKDIGKGRRPDAVEFTTDIKIDVQRRDLTVNALYYDIGKGTIVDVVGGIKDLQKRQARTVGDPNTRFDEDPLRKLRAVRFAGVLGGKMHKDTWNSLKNNPDISSISPERIRDEFIKGIKKSKSVPVYLKMLQKLKMFKQIFPGFKVNISSLNSNDYILQIAYMLRQNNKDVVKSKLNGLKYKNQETLDIWVLHCMSRPGDVVNDLPSFKKYLGNSKLKSSQIKTWAKMISNKYVIQLWNWKLTVSAKDAIDKGLKGKDIGDYIKDTEKELFLKGPKRNKGIGY